MMTIYDRSGIGIHAALAPRHLLGLALASLLIPVFSVTASFADTALDPDSPIHSAFNSDTAESASFPPADSSALHLDIKPVLAHNYSGIDTAALLARIQERLKWSERDDRLVEAEGILHWDRGDVHLALPCFKRLTSPSALAMGLLGEGLLRKGERYEAAGWFLKSARAGQTGDPFTVAMLRKYLEIKPNDPQAEMQLAMCLEQQMLYSEAAGLYWKHRIRIIREPEATLRVGAMLSSQGRKADAAILYSEARDLHPEAKDISMRLAETREALGMKLEAARAWADAWALDGSDTSARNRALALMEAAGASGEAAMKDLLGKILTYSPASADLQFRMSELLLRMGDRKGAYVHLSLALETSPGNPAYVARLPDVIEGDSQMLAHFPALRNKFEKEGASLKLALMVARGYSLTGEKDKACGAWMSISQLSPKSLEGRRDAFLDLTACGDPAYLALATAIGEKRLNAGFDREATRSLIQIAMRSRDFAKASGYAKRLVIEAPEDVPLALAAAKAMLDAGKNEEAKEVLAAISKHAPVPEGSLLLGRLYYEAKDRAAASEQFQLARDAFPEAIRLRAECLAELRNFEGAAAEFSTHHARTGDKESLRAVARMYRELHSGSKEAEVLAQLDSKGWAGDDDKLRMGMLKAGQGQARQAKEIFEGLFLNRTVLPAGNEWRDAALMIGTQWAGEGKLDQAIAVLNLGLRNAPVGIPGLADAWVRLGECLAEKRLWKEALAAYGSAVAIDSLSGEAAGEMLKVAKLLDAKKEMADAYRAIYRSEKNNEEANAFLGSVRQYLREYKEAAAHFRKVTQHRPNDALAWENLGNALSMIPDLAAASGPLQTAIDLGAQSDEVYINRARAYRKEGSKDMAASILEFLLNRDEQSFLATLWSAKFAEEDGKQDLALELYKKTARLTAPRTPWPELASQGMLEAKASASVAR